jgi:hypothetical protein
VVAIGHQLPASGYALEVDGRLKAEFATRDGAEMGAVELKKRFPMLRIKICDTGGSSASARLVLDASLLEQALLSEDARLVACRRPENVSNRFQEFGCIAERRADDRFE